MEVFFTGGCCRGGLDDPVLDAGSEGGPAWRSQSDGTRSDERKASVHPYLARQMSDFRIRQPVRGSNTGVCAEISTCPSCLLAILPSLARRAHRHKDTEIYTTSGHHYGLIPYSSVVWWIASRGYG